MIIIGNVKRSTGPAATGARLHKPCEVIGEIFASLSSKREPSTDERKLILTGAEALAMEAVLQQVPLLPLPTGTAGLWLPAILAGVDGITRKLIRYYMTTWLNYIVVHVPSDSETRVVIDNCLMRLGQWEVTSHIWGNQWTYGVGHWYVELSLTQHHRRRLTLRSRVFNCLLGSDLGRDVAWLLAKRKGDRELGRKAIKSIAVFHADRVDGLTAEEAEKYVTPVMIFEVVTDSEELRAAWRDMDAADGRIPYVIPYVRIPYA